MDNGGATLSCYCCEGTHGDERPTPCVSEGEVKLHSGGCGCCAPTLGHKGPLKQPEGAKVVSVLTLTLSLHQATVLCEGVAGMEVSNWECLLTHVSCQLCDANGSSLVPSSCGLLLEKL